MGVNTDMYTCFVAISYKLDILPPVGQQTTFACYLEVITFGEDLTNFNVVIADLGVEGLVWIGIHKLFLQNSKW